jgi:hypothetical protein
MLNTETLLLLSLIFVFIKKFTFTREYKCFIYKRQFKCKEILFSPIKKGNTTTFVSLCALTYKIICLVNRWRIFLPSGDHTVVCCFLRGTSMLILWTLRIYIVDFRMHIHRFFEMCSGNMHKQSSSKSSSTCTVTD